MTGKSISCKWCGEPCEDAAAFYRHLDVDHASVASERAVAEQEELDAIAADTDDPTPIPTMDPVAKAFEDAGMPVPNPERVRSVGYSFAESKALRRYYDQHPPYDPRLAEANRGARRVRVESVPDELERYARQARGYGPELVLQTAWQEAELSAQDMVVLVRFMRELDPKWRPPGKLTNWLAFELLPFVPASEVAEWLGRSARNIRDLDRRPPLQEDGIALRHVYAKDAETALQRGAGRKNWGPQYDSLQKRFFALRRDLLGSRREQECAVCSKPFQARRSTGRYCSQRCKDRAAYVRAHEHRDAA